MNGLAVPDAGGCNQYWSMDFVHDQLVTGRAFRVLTVVDQWSRESVLLGGCGGHCPDAKQAISLRLDEDVLDWFRRGGPRYQTRMNAVLRMYVKRMRKHA